MTQLILTSSLIPFHDGRRWGYKNTEGRVVIQPQFEQAGVFSNGLAHVKIGNKAGTIPPLCNLSKTAMTRVEGENGRLRHYLVRLHRQGLCYSKTKEMLNLSIRLLQHYLKTGSVAIPP